MGIKLNKIIWASAIIGVMGYIWAIILSLFTYLLTTSVSGGVPGYPSYYPTGTRVINYPDTAALLVIQCCVCLSSVVVVVCTECLAKWCVLDQKLLLTASYMRNRLVPKWMALTFVYRSYEGHDEGLSKTIKVGPAIDRRRPCFNCAWQLTSPPFLSLSHSFSLSPLPSVSCQYIDQSKIRIIHVLTFFFLWLIFCPFY